MTDPEKRPAADRVRRVLILTAGPVALLMFWFLGVDWSWFVEDCPDCGYSADVAQYRILTVPVSTEVRTYPTIIQRIAADLGKPCTHPRLSRWHKHRWWGLCVCAAPCINGLLRLTSEDADAWYDTKENRVRAMGRADPTLGEAWHRRVILGHDGDYRDRFADRLGPREPVEAPR